MVLPPARLDPAGPRMRPGPCRRLPVAMSTMT